jgi:hypothetical protein
MTSRVSLYVQFDVCVSTSIPKRTSGTFGSAGSRSSLRKTSASIRPLFWSTIDGIRVISFRKANPREVARYAKVQASR